MSKPSVIKGRRWAAAANISNGTAVSGPASTISAV